MPEDHSQILWKILFPTVFARSLRHQSGRGFDVGHQLRCTENRVAYPRNTMHDGGTGYGTSAMHRALESESFHSDLPGNGKESVYFRSGTR